jgi:hypothetical protein
LAGIYSIGLNRHAFPAWGEYCPQVLAAKDRLPFLMPGSNIPCFSSAKLEKASKELPMLWKLSSCFVIAAVLATALNLPANEPDKEKPLRERFYIANSVGATLDILETELVQKEIGLTEAQKAKIVPLCKEFRESYDKIFRDNPETPASQEESKMELDESKTYTGKDGSVTIPWKPRKPSLRELKIREASQEADQRVQKQLVKILQSDQLDRIWEILLQAGCFFQAGSDAMGGLPDLDKVQAELTPKQLEAIAKMKGKEIDFIQLLEQLTDHDVDELREMPAPGKK